MITGGPERAEPGLWTGEAYPQMRVLAGARVATCSTVLLSAPDWGASSPGGIMQESHTILVGNLTADPTLKWVQSGAPVCNFRIGVTPRWRDRESGQWRDGSSMFVGVDCWRTLAENANATLRKGDRVVVVGRLRQRSYLTPEGQERINVEVDAETIGPDLNRHVATLRKASRSSTAGGSGSPPSGEGHPDGADANNGQRGGPQRSDFGDPEDADLGDPEPADLGGAEPADFGARDDGRDPGLEADPDVPSAEQFARLAPAAD